MKTDKPARSTATRACGCHECESDPKDLGVTVTVVTNNHRPILGTLSEVETVVLGGMLDRLDGLEAAIRVRPNDRAIAALREQVAIDMEMDGEPSDRLAAHAAAILLDMLDKITAVPK